MKMLGLGSRTHTISNTSTFRGWLESMGLDEILMNPCSCILGQDEDQPVPIPGQRTRGQSGNGSRQQSTKGGRRRLGRQESVEVPIQEEPKSIFPFNPAFLNGSFR